MTKKTKDWFDTHVIIDMPDTMKKKDARKFKKVFKKEIIENLSSTETLAKAIIKSID